MPKTSKLGGHAHGHRVRILVYSGDPGGAEAVAPVVPRFPKAWQTKVLAKTLALTTFRRYGSKPMDCSTWSWESMEKKCNEWSPMAILLSASSLPEKDPTEMRLRRWAKSKSIPAVAIMDTWQNYSLRFRNPASGKITDLPERIAVMDSGAVKDMVADGLPKAILAVTGHPGLESAGSMLRKNRSLSTGLSVLRLCHFSQPIRDFWGDSLGYDEFDVAKDLISLIPALEAGLQRKVRLDIKLHPKESRRHFLSMVGNLPRGVRILSEKSDSFVALSQCDIALGMGSIMLVKAALGSIPAICYAPGREGSVENSCIIAKRGLIPTIRNKEKLGAVIQGLTSDTLRAKHVKKQDKFGRHRGAAKNVVRLVKDCLR